MKFSTFIDMFVAALYNETQFSGRTKISVGDILDRYGLPFQNSWREAFFKDYHLSSRVNFNRHLGPIREQLAKISPDGIRWVEDELGENVAAFLEANGAIYSTESVPASDRIVTLGHNCKAHAEVKAGIGDLKEALRSTNDIPIDGDERQRLMAGLEAAELLWDAAQLKLIQIKIGVIMAVEDARKVLAGTAKAVAGELVVDAIKSLVKNQLGIDVDNI